MTEKIHCMICNKEFKQIHYRHTKQHGLTIEEYKLKFPNSPINSEASSKSRSSSLMGREITWSNKISESNKNSWKENPKQGRTGIALSDESRKKLSEKLTGHEVSYETRIKISLIGMGRTPWNKGLTKENDNRLISVSEKIKIWNQEHMTEEIRHQISQTLKNRYKNGMPIPQSKGNKRLDLGRYFRSRWEANYARILNYNNIKWEYETKRFSLTEGNEIVCVYTPDFMTDRLIEIKGHATASDDWSCECSRCIRDKMKMLLFSEQYQGEKIDIIGKKEYRELCKQYASIIPNWEKSSYDP